MAMSSGKAATPQEPARGPASAPGEAYVVDGCRYLRRPVPLHFPEAELVPESKRHLEQRTALYQILKLAFARHAAVGCDQFVYWDPTDPKAVLAPDAFVRLGTPDEQFRTWKVWERGAPDVAIEIISASDERDADWDAKLEKYRRLGVRELVRFDAEVAPASLRVWNRLEGDLVEREGVHHRAPSQCLPGTWVVVDDAELGPLLRLSHDAEGKRLYPTPVEREAEARHRETELRKQEAELRKQEAELRKQEAELRKQEGIDRERAEARVRELEAQLATLLSNGNRGGSS